MKSKTLKIIIAENGFILNNGTALKIGKTFEDMLTYLLNEVYPDRRPLDVVNELATTIRNRNRKAIRDLQKKKTADLRKLSNETPPPLPSAPDFLIED